MSSRSSSHRSIRIRTAVRTTPVGLDLRLSQSYRVERAIPESRESADMDWALIQRKSRCSNVRGGSTAITTLRA